MITREEIENIALLSKLYVAEEEIEKITKDMEQMMEFADIVANSCTGEEDKEDSDIRETPLREDAVGESLPLSDISANAPQFTQGYFVLRKEA